MFLPGSVMEKSESLSFGNTEIVSRDLKFLTEIGELDFGEDIKFQPSKILAKFQQEAKDVNVSLGSRKLVRFGYRQPQLALVFADLLIDPQQILMVTVAVALKEIGYKIEVYSLEDGPVRAVWTNIGVPVNIIKTSEKMENNVDWLNYDGVIANSFEARAVISFLLQEPFKTVPLIWAITERTLATRLKEYESNGQNGLLNNWKLFFNRAAVVVFPNYVLPMLYSACDTGNFLVIPASLTKAWEADNYMALPKVNPKVKIEFDQNDFVIAIVGSQLLYKGLWLEHTAILQALLPISKQLSVDDSSNSRLKIIILTGDTSGNYSVVVEAISINLKYPKGIVRHLNVDETSNFVLKAADLVVYGSLVEEQIFPDILIKAMCFGKPVVAPDLSMITKYVDDRVNGYIFPKENIRPLTQIVSQLISRGKISPLARNVASIGKNTAKNLMVSETVEGYAFLLGNVLKLSSEIMFPEKVDEIPRNLTTKWQWNLFQGIRENIYANKSARSFEFLDKVEKQITHSQIEKYGVVEEIDETYLYGIWDEEKRTVMLNTRKRREEEELKDRSNQPRGSWEEVYKNAKKADRLKNDLHERDEGELERTGQPLTIYEPYYGQGAFPFLHNSSLYRGLGLSTKGRRSGADDVDAPARLQILNNPYYRDALGEVGGFFAIANRIDRIHKNAWIGFQSWRATARKESLSKAAEKALIDDIESRKHGDALYFWVRMDTDQRNPLRQDFWSFCDSINSGNCKYAFSEALKKMYGVKHELKSLPPMPSNGDTWSVMHTWVLPTRSFLEYIMFSRMFVDALDAQIYNEHYRTGHCYLSLSKDKHCYSRILELLVNVWAYHSARHIIYINPKTGEMQEQHPLPSRKNQMWVKWFQYGTLKNMDEDLAEESDSDNFIERRLWPLTGEVFWQGIYEKERSQRNREKEKRRQQSKDKISRIRKRTRQKTIGRYVKPSDTTVNSSLTVS
jgi:glycosyltransferase involved in cell wall biosynthesis